MNDAAELNAIKLKRKSGVFGINFVILGLLVWESSSSGERKDWLISPDGSLARMPFGDAVDFFQREGREDQVGNLSLPGECFCFVEGEPENARVSFQQQTKITLDLCTNCCEGGVGGL